MTVSYPRMVHLKGFSPSSWSDQNTLRICNDAMMVYRPPEQSIVSFHIQQPGHHLACMKGAQGSEMLLCLGDAQSCCDLCSVYTYDDATGSASVSLALSSPNADGTARGALSTLPQG